MLKTEKTEVYLLSESTYSMPALKPGSGPYNGFTHRFLADGQDLRSSSPTLSFKAQLEAKKGAPLKGEAVFELRAQDGKYKLRLVSFDSR